MIDKDYDQPKLNKSGYNKNYAQCESKGDKILSLKEYLNLIEKYLRELIEEYKLKGEWKVQLIIEVNFISLKPGSDETRIMYARSDNIEKLFLSKVEQDLFKTIETPTRYSNLSSD